MRQIPGPSPALIEMLREDGILDEILSGRVSPPSTFELSAFLAEQRK